MADDPIQKAIDAIKEVVEVHKNHLYPIERIAFAEMIDRLVGLQKGGYR